MKRLFIRTVLFYRRWISPAKLASCRFLPTCSEFAIDAINQHGTLRGAALTAGRLARCHPLARGGLDPVPAPRAGKER